MQTFQIKVTRIYTDMNGTVVNKTLVPAAMQKKVPFYLFNKFDKEGGYAIGQTIKPVQPGMYFLYSYVNDASYNFLDFQFGNTINRQLRPGDVIHVLADDPIIPNFLCHIILHSDYVSYASFLANMQGKNYKISRMQYVTDNELNYHESFNTPIVDDFGLYTDNQIQPLVYKTPYELTLGFLDMIIDLNITDKNGLYSYMLFTTDEIELTFYIDTILDLNANTNKNGNSNSQAILYEIK
jgi:hypothetical protein